MKKIARFYFELPTWKFGIVALGTALIILSLSILAFPSNLVMQTMYDTLGVSWLGFVMITMICGAIAIIHPGWRWNWLLLAIPVSLYQAIIIVRIQEGLNPLSSLVTGLYGYLPYTVCYWIIFHNRVTNDD